MDKGGVGVHDKRGGVRLHEDHCHPDHASGPCGGPALETANECYLNQEYDRALESYLEVMDIYEAIGYPDGTLRGGLYHMVGVCHSRLGDEGAAMRCFEDSP